jgi:hypothetical protein
MKIRRAVEDFVKRGPLPDQGVATEHDLDQRYAMLKMIAPPVTDEEAIALAESFGPDECFGLAWTLLHLIETSPNHPRPSESTFQRSEWLRMVWKERRSKATE